MRIKKRRERRKESRKAPRLRHVFLLLLLALLKINEARSNVQKRDMRANQNATKQFLLSRSSFGCALRLSLQHTEWFRWLFCWSIGLVFVLPLLLNPSTQMRFCFRMWCSFSFLHLRQRSTSAQRKQGEDELLFALSLFHRIHRIHSLQACAFLFDGTPSIGATETGSAAGSEGKTGGMPN